VISGIWLFNCVLGYNRLVVVCGNLCVFGFGFEFERFICLLDLAVFCGFECDWYSVCCGLVFCLSLLLCVWRMFVGWLNWFGFWVVISNSVAFIRMVFSLFYCFVCFGVCFCFGLVFYLLIVKCCLV